MPGKFLKEKPCDWHKAEHSQRLESLINVRMKARRYDSFQKESKAITTRVKIPCRLSWAIHCVVPFSENSKGQRLAVKIQRKFLINTESTHHLVPDLSATNKQNPAARSLPENPPWY